MSDWETLKPNRTSDGWETVAAPAPLSPAQRATNLAREYAPFGPYAPVVGASRALLGGMSEISDAAGSGATELASRAGLPPEVAGGVGVAANIGAGAVMPGALGKAATGAAPLLQSTATNLMTKAVKPSKADLLSGDAAKGIQTMLDEGIFATEGGLLKLRVKINELNDQIKEAIKTSPENVDKLATYKQVKDVLDRFSKQVNPRSDKKAITDAWDEFKAEWPDIMPVQLAQELKQGTYRALADKYGEVSGAATEAQKAIARGLKEQIADRVPRIADLNAKESELINALEVARRGGVLTAGNKNVFGLGALVDPRTWPLWLADRSPAAMSTLARLLNAGQERIPQATVGLTAAGAEALGNRK